MIEAYCQVGKRIVEEEQSGKSKAEYSSELIKNISTELTKDLGRGFSETNIRNFRKFYLIFPDFNTIRQTVSAELTWSHF